MNNVPPSLKNINFKAVLRSRGVYFEQKVNREMKQAAIPVAKKLLSKKTKAPEPQRYVHFTNEQAMAYAHKQIHIIEVIEKRFELKVQQFITKMVHGFLSQIETQTKKVNKDFFDDAEDEFIAQAQLDFTPLLMDQVILSGQQALDLLNSGGVYTPYDLRKKIAENVTKFTQSMLDTDRQKLIDILNNGLEQGQSVGDIRNAITADFEQITKNQAQIITRTEVARASNQGSLDAWEQSGVVEGKQWVVMEGGDECDAYDGQVESLDGNFYADTTEFADGDPPLHPNCKCVLIPVLLDEAKVYSPSPNKQMGERIKELEGQIDKRTKEFRELKSARADDLSYINSLEDHLGLHDES